MFSFILLICEVFFIIMMGSFYRATSFSLDNAPFITFGLTLLLAFIFISVPYRKLTLFSLLLLLIVMAAGFQTFMLFGKFFDSLFVGEFSPTVEITTVFICRGLYAVLAVLIVNLDILGLFEYWEVYVYLTFVLTVGCAFIDSVILYGFNIYDGGGGITVFLYSGVCTLMIWAIAIRGRVSLLTHKKSQSYLSHTMGFVGVVIGLISWPVFNMGGALKTMINTDLTASTSLTNSAYANTFMGLIVAVLCSMILVEHNNANSSPSEKLKPKVYIECFLNGGIVIATFQDLTLDPVSCMVLSLFASISTVIVDKYIFQKTEVRQENDVRMLFYRYSQVLYRVVFSFVSSVIAAIVIVTREGGTLEILTTYADQYGEKAGLTIAAWVVGFLTAAVFGAVAGVGINVLVGLRQKAETGKPEKLTKIVDESFFDDLSEEIFPIYKDIFESQEQIEYEEDLTRRFLHESLLKQEQVAANIYETVKRNTDTNESDDRDPQPVKKETIVISNEFSRDNPSPAKEINLSAMKFNPKGESQKFDQIREEPIASENQNKKIPISRRVEAAPHSGFESQRPREKSLLEHPPSEMKVNRSAARLSQLSMDRQEELTLRESTIVKGLNRPTTETKPKRLIFEEENDDSIREENALKEERAINQ